MNLEIFKYEIKFSSWGEIYAGLKRNWISVNDIFDIYKGNHVYEYDENRLVELYIAYDESLFKLLKTIKLFLEKDNDLRIVKNEDEIDKYFDYIPDEYWEIWKLEFLLKIKHNDFSKERKLKEIAALFHNFNFPDDWLSFIYYQPQKNNVPIGIEKLYKNMLIYTEDQIKIFQKNAKRKKVTK